MAYITFLAVSFGVAVAADLYGLYLVRHINHQEQEDIIKRIQEG